MDFFGGPCWGACLTHLGVCAGPDGGLASSPLVPPYLKRCVQSQSYKSRAVFYLLAQTVTRCVGSINVYRSWCSTVVMLSIVVDLFIVLFSTVGRRIKIV